MGVAIPVALRGALWLATAFGIGSWFGGDKIENQTVIKETSTIEKVLWVVLLGAVFVLIYLFIKKNWR